MVPALEGKVIHRLQLDGRCSNIRKRKRDRKYSVERNQRELWESSGLVFVPNKSSSHAEFLLSLPQLLSKFACDAALNQQNVRITQYTVIPLFSTEYKVPTKQIALLEVHSGGFQIDGPTFDACEKDPPMSDIWTLTQFRRREAFDDEETNADRRRTYSIVATVDAISPILSMDPTDPFALVELYDKDARSGDHSCTLVLTCPKDLMYHSAIFPGDLIICHRIRRQPWPVPEILKNDKRQLYQYLGTRIPPFVFTSNEHSRIQWQRSTTIPPIPSTAIPLVSLEGEIGHSETLSNPSSSVVHAHWVEILDGRKKTIGKLYLTHFPMSTALQLGMQTGAIVRAVNIHKLCDPLPASNYLFLFGACLRSTITIVQFASDPKKALPSACLKDATSTGSSDEETPMIFETQPTTAIESNQVLQSYELSVQGVMPYQLNKVRISYRDYVYRSHIEDWLENSFPRTPSFDFLRLPPVSSFIDLVGVQGTKDEIKEGEAQNGNRRVSMATAIRNPYAEFFDHGDEDIGRTEHSVGSCGCDVSRHEPSNQFRTTFIGLQKIRSTSHRIFATRFARLVGREKKFGRPGGWTGSIHLETNELLSDIGEAHGSFLWPNCVLYTGGHVVEFRTDRTTPASISDKHCQLPVSFSKPSNAVKGDFVVGNIRKVIISCLCLFQSKSAAVSQASDNVFTQDTSLPPVKTVYFNDASLVGSCALMRVGEFVLVVSVQIVCDGTPFTFGTVTKKESPSADERRMKSIEACLSNPGMLMNMTTIDCTKGVLLRSRFVHAKVNHKGCSQSCVLTLCSVPSDATTSTQSIEMSHLQTMDVKLSMHCTASNLAVFKKSFTSLCAGLPIVEDQCVLGAAWWNLADSGRTCALVSGGWDEVSNEKSDVQKESVVTISLPSSAMKVANRGYVRCACQSNEIEASFGDIEKARDVNFLHHPSSTNMRRTEQPAFDFIGGRRVYDGMLAQRPRRRQVFGPNSTRPIGDLVSPSQAPKLTLSDMFRTLCRSLRSSASMGLSPSLVQHLSGSHFLGVLFCQVQCVCSQCFKPLKDLRPDKLKKRHENDEEQSFWHLPAPGDASERSAGSSGPSKVPPYILHSKLRCPNNHSPEAYTVQWECSGILDDGTGQAKLYAEREVAMTLLGMDASTIQSIEEGIWSTSVGALRFSKSIPPPAYLQDRIQAVQHLVNPLQRLPPSIRAEYLLQHHCRSSAAPQRPLEYFVRCKPLSDQIRHLHHTMTESSFCRSDSSLTYQEVATYALPPLKLVLVDVACPVSENQFPYL